MGTCQENMGFSEMRGGMTMFRTVHLKIRITRCYGILVYKHAMKSIDHCQKENICQIIDLVIPDDGRVRAKEDEKREISRSRERNPKNVGRKDKGDT